MKRCSPTSICSQKPWTFSDGDEKRKKEKQVTRHVFRPRLLHFVIICLMSTFLFVSQCHNFVTIVTDLNLTATKWPWALHRSVCRLMCVQGQEEHQGLVYCTEQEHNVIAGGVVRQSAGMRGVRQERDGVPWHVHIIVFYIMFFKGKGQNVYYKFCCV